MNLIVVTAWLGVITGVWVIFAPLAFNPSYRQTLSDREHMTSFSYHAFDIIGTGVYLSLTSVYMTSFPKMGNSGGYVFFGLVASIITGYLISRASSFERKLRLTWLFLTTVAVWLKAIEQMRPGAQPNLHSLQACVLIGVVIFGITAAAFTIREARLRRKAETRTPKLEPAI